MSTNYETPNPYANSALDDMEAEWILGLISGRKIVTARPPSLELRGRIESPPEHMAEVIDLGQRVTAAAVRLRNTEALKEAI